MEYKKTLFLHSSIGNAIKLRQLCSACILIATFSCLQREELQSLLTTKSDNLWLWMLLVQDVASLNTFFQSNFSTTPEEKQLSVSGKNWGEVDLNGMCIPFITFEIPFLCP